MAIAAPQTRGHPGASTLETSLKQNSSHIKIFFSFLAFDFLFHYIYLRGPTNFRVFSAVELIRTNFRAGPSSAFSRTLFLSLGSRIGASERKDPLHEMHVLMVLCQVHALIPLSGMDEIGD